MSAGKKLKNLLPSNEMVNPPALTVHEKELRIDRSCKVQNINFTGHRTFLSESIVIVNGL